MFDPSVRLTFCTSPQDFLSLADDFLAADPLLSTVVATVTARMRDDLANGSATADPTNWWVVVHDGSGHVVGAAMRTAPTPPFPPYLMPMPAEAAKLLACELYERGEDVGGVNGALPETRLFADAYAGLTGAEVSVRMHTRLFELGELRRPPPAPGRLRTATDNDLDLAVEWFAAFGRDADEQAGRPPEEHHEDGAGYPDRDRIAGRIRSGRLWFWEDEHGTPVHLTGANPPAFGVARIGPVFTPREFRRRGFAASAVAEVSAILRANGERVCLFTDQANPTSNKVYQSIGFLPVVDMANLQISRQGA